MFIIVKPYYQPVLLPQRHSKIRKFLVVNSFTQPSSDNFPTYLTHRVSIDVLNRTLQLVVYKQGTLVILVVLVKPVIQSKSYAGLLSQLPSDGTFIFMDMLNAFFYQRMMLGKFFKHW